VNRPAKAVATLLLVVAALAVEAQSPRPSTPAPAPSPLHLRIDPAALAGLSRRTISATDERGRTNSYTGVSLDELLVRAGAPTGMPVRGRAMLSYVLVGAVDGYHVIFTLPEIDPSFTDHVVLIAESRDGAPLPADTGPYRLVVPFDKRDARWVRQVTNVDLLNAQLP
jgi:hypothetical protein